jgi:flagella basal body P-ring formation protein FlgA
MQRIFLYSALFTLAAWSAEAAEVRLKAEAACSGAIVRLKDVADVTSTSENEAAALAELQLFPVPSAGKVRNVRRGEIRELLALSDVNLKAVTLSGAEKLIIRRAEAQPSVVPAATAAVVPTAYTTPSTKIPRVIETAGVDLVPVTVRPLEKGAVLRAGDLELRPSAIPKESGFTAPKIEDLLGKELLRQVPAGQPIFKDVVQAPRVVRRNDKVRIRAVAAGVVVSTDGKALDEGGEGDNVLVEDGATKEKLMARVTGYRVVELLGTGVKRLR